MNKLLEEEKADKIREQFQETLPFDTETLFLVLVVGAGMRSRSRSRILPPT